MTVFRLLWRHRALIAVLVRRDLDARYRASVLGFFWSLLNPLLLLAVYAVVFTYIFSPRFPGGDPYPLFLGLDWHSNHQESTQPELHSNDFALLCQIRRTFCHTNAITMLSVEQIEQYADLLAYWGLPRPLYDFEMILKHKAVAKNLQYVMTRLLGRQVLETITNRTPIDPEVVRQNEAVILVMDVRKFSTLSEHRTPEEIFDFLNPIFKIMHEELGQAGGTILEFIGDCVVIVFNTFKGEQARICSAQASAVDISCSRGTTWLTSPICRAS